MPQSIFRRLHERKKIMKKLFCIITVIILILGTVQGIGASEEGGKVTVVGMSATKGNLVDLRISLSGNAGIDSLTLDFSYDSSALLMYGITDTGVLEGAYHGYNEEAECFRLSWTDGGNGNGTIAVITFMVKENAEAGRYPVTAVSEEVSVSGGFIKVCEETPGDVTSDGERDEDDINAISEYAAGWSGAEVSGNSGDINGDEKVNLLDAIIIARNIAGKAGYSIDIERDEIDTASIVEHDEDEE